MNVQHPLIIRLIRVIHLREKHWEELNEIGQRMMNKVISSCYIDCMDAGLLREARGAAWAAREKESK